ncbi:MAG: hypothetical protein KTR24_09660 [Saprospiraceae bacterium]|nr:hypothetical protein [Saprospiraceae bacterium]
MLIKLMQGDVEQTILKEIGASLRGDPAWSNHVLEQPCLLMPESTQLVEEMEGIQGGMIGIFEIRTGGIALFVSRSSNPFVLVIPFWKLHFAKGPDTITLFSAEHKIKVKPLNDDLRGFSSQLIEMKLTLQGEDAGPNPG